MSKLLDVSREEVLREMEMVERTASAKKSIINQVSKRIIGQESTIEKLLVLLFAKGHGLLIGVPGLAKTTLISTLAQTLDLKFSRIQFTPDLMPSDITGTEVLEEDKTTGKRIFKFIKGPVFANILLADEINRAPPKTQSALLEAMQERRVTVGGETYDLNPPFIVFATQNPIEQEGTYPLPEAQLDRFMMSIQLTYPDITDEVEIVKSTTSPITTIIEKVLSPKEIVDIQEGVLHVPIADHTIRFAVNIVRKTRPNKGNVPKEVQDYVEWGAGPRCSQHLIYAAKALALLRGDYVVTEEHIREITIPVLSHRIVLNFHAQAERVRVETIIERILKET